MPAYDAKCIHCGTVIERSFDSEWSGIHARCEKCNMITFHKKMPPLTAFSLKGAGWFRDGYDKAGKK